MRSKPALAFTFVLVVCLAWGSPARAQETPAPETPAASEKAPPESFWKKTFGDRFAMFIEFGYGAGASDPIETSVRTGVGSVAFTDFEIDDLTAGRISVGWKLPEDKGRYVLTMNGFAEESYTFSGFGLTDAVLRQPDNALVAPGYPVAWWSTSMSGGTMTTQRFLPLWTDQPDDDGVLDGKVAPDEIAYSDTPDLVLSRAVPETLENRAQTWDAYYQRDFGGRRFALRWTAGARYFVYEGNLPSTAWLIAASAQGGAGYTDGFSVPGVLTRQETTGWGPMGSAEFQSKFFRGRMVIYAGVNAAFLLESLSSDTGDFFTLVRRLPSDELIPSPARLQKELDKSVWQLGGEVGIRGRIAQGLDIFALWSVSAYTDALLYPKEMLIPDTPDRIPVGTSALYQTSDLVYDNLLVGLSYQF